MTWTVVRLLGVYAISCAGMLFLADRYLAPLSARALLFLALIPLTITGRAILSGGTVAPLDISYQSPPLSAQKAEFGFAVPRNLNLNDVVMQEIPWRKAVREAVKNGRLPLWNRFLMCGEPLLAIMLPAVLHPFTWIGMALPLPDAWTLEMTLGGFLALVSAYVFFRDLGLSAAAAALGAMGWAFSDYLRFYAGWPLTPGAAPFPLLLLGLRRVARDGDRASVAITTVSLLLILVAGHPETVLHAVAGAGIWFLWCLASETSGRRLRAVALSVVAGVTALCLTAVILLPHLEALRQTLEYTSRTAWWAHQKKSLPLAQALATFQQIVMPYAFGVSGQGQTAPGAQISQAYVGSLLLPFAAIGLAARTRGRWVFLTLAVLGFGMWVHVPGITDAVSALPLFDIAINEWLVFLGSFGLCALAALGADAVLRDGRRGRPLIGLLLTIGLLTGMFLAIRGRLSGLDMPAAYAAQQLAYGVIPPLLAAVLVIAGAGAKRRAYWLPAGLVILLLAQRALETAPLYPVSPRRAFYPGTALLDSIPRNEPYRMGGLGFTFIPNVAAMYELEDVRGYETMTFSRLWDTYPLWCVYQPVFFNRIDDAERPFLSFLNVRYLITKTDAPIPATWRLLAEGPGGRVIENTRVLPRVFVPSDMRAEPDRSRQVALMGEFTDFARQGILTAGRGFPAGAWTRNGSAVATIRRYRPQSLDLDVDAREPAVIGTSVTGWKGWRLSVDGKDAELLEYNHAFLGFLVGSGHHTVSLRYLPGSFLAGAALSAATLLAILGYGLLLFARYRRKSVLRT